jgi:hypothetical protein
MGTHSFILAGGASALARDVPVALAAAGYAAADGPEATALLHLDTVADADTVVAECGRFAAQVTAPAAIITLVQGGADWPAARRFACLSAFTRQAARDWAPRGIRVNTVGIGIPGPAGWNAADPLSGTVPAEPATPADLARVVMAILNLPSMTGQLIRLGS